MARCERRAVPWHACVAWLAIAGGASAFAAGVMLAAMRFGTTATAYAGSTLALLAMAALPVPLSRSFMQRATVPVATTLLLTMAAMHAATALARETAYPLLIGGLMILVAGCAFAPRTSVHTHTPRARRSNPSAYAPGWWLAPALLAGVSSGLLARFQWSAICGSASGASLAQVGLSLGIVTLAGLAMERFDRRHALLMLFVLRAAWLAALTLDLVASHAAMAAAAFAMLDALTLPTLMRPSPTTNTANPACPGIAHHAGMLAGAALATTSWGFGQGFPAVFLLGSALNLACAFATSRRAISSDRASASPTRMQSSALELQQ
ncbi:hypothetical protein [Paraburkholderia acidisoli]|uniref:Uncharacterized protein n=1 Tax=Paraburkholderia acidisoli TaxID=2571748 RepID=A0A7Z2GI07_9BURK|nr:hypothetical protein [Paraburkholderia acidisoli]QGZ61810.1 hypothetical protein FAZ98_08735 [Paraburkholderia acidisoli]